MKPYCYLLLVLSAYELHCYSTSEIGGNQRRSLIDRFQNVLMSDSERLFTLEKAFLLPRRIGRKCLSIDVTVKGRIDITKFNNPENYCDLQNNSCIVHMTKYFEVLPAAAAPQTTLVNFLRSDSIVQALEALDPSFHGLINVISNDLLDYTYDYYDSDNMDPTPYMYNSYDIYITVGNINITDPSQIELDITDAVYVTLSWVSCIITVCC